MICVTCKLWAVLFYDMIWSDMMHAAGYMQYDIWCMVLDIYIYIWSPPPPGPTFSHPRRGRCHRDIYNKIAHSTETMEKTVKNEHLSNWKLICTESKNCCKSVLFRPKFGLESHGLRYIWYPPNKNLPLCMFYWYLHLWFDYVKKKKKQKNLEKTKKNKKTIFQLLQSKNPKKPWENPKNQKN